MTDEQKGTKDVLEIVAIIIGLFVSVLTAIGTFRDPGSWRLFLIAFFLIAVVFSGIMVYRFVRRKKRERHSLPKSTQKKAFTFNGALSYTTDDAHRFFGRSRDSFHIYQQINQEKYRLGVLYGPSGVGKTSIIEAGLIPKLNHENVNSVNISMGKLPKRKGSKEDLNKFVTNQACRRFELQNCKNLQDIDAKLDREASRYNVIFLDQFEQIFGFTIERERQQFVQELEEFCKSAKSIKIVIIVRKDYFSDVYDMIEDLGRDNSSKLYKFNLTQAREVIRKSAGFDESLDETDHSSTQIAFETAILDDLKDGDDRIHPVELSLICTTIMKTIGVLSKSYYLEGGKKQGWLKRYLDDVLDGPQQDEALQLLSSLIELDKTSARSLKEIADSSGLKMEKTRQLLDDLVYSRLVVEDTDKSDPEKNKYRLAHEYLIEPIRLKCGDVETDVQKWKRRVDSRAKVWEQEDKKAQFLLKGKELRRVRWKYYDYLGLESDSLNKEFVEKSAKLYIKKWVALLVGTLLLAFLLSQAYVFFDVRSKVDKYRISLKGRDLTRLNEVTKQLTELSEETINIKIKVFRDIIHTDTKSIYLEECLPAILHLMIGPSAENRDKLLKDLITHRKSKNVNKLRFLFSRENFVDVATKKRFQNLLLENVKDTKNTEFIQFAAYALSEIGNKDVVETLIELLGDTHDVPEKCSIVSALGRFSEDRVVKLLIELLKDPNEDIRQSASESLGKIGAVDAVQSLVRLLNDPDRDITTKEAAAIALGKIGTDEAIKVLKDRAEKHKDDTRICAIKALSYIQRNDVVELLTKLLENPDEGTKLYVIEALGKIKAHAAIDSIITQLNLPDSNFVNPLYAIAIKEEAVKALGEIGTGKAVLALSEIIAHPNPSPLEKKLKKIAVEKLGDIRISLPKSNQLLLSLLRNSDNDLKQRAATALGKIGGETVKAYDSIKTLYEAEKGEKSFQAKSLYLRAMIRLNPTMENYIDLIIRQYLFHPETAINNLKARLIAAVEDSAKKLEPKRKIDFEKNMWKMLRWWHRRSGK